MVENNVKENLIDDEEEGCRSRSNAMFRLRYSVHGVA